MFVLCASRAIADVQSGIALIPGLLANFPSGNGATVPNGIGATRNRDRQGTNEDVEESTDRCRRGSLARDPGGVWHSPEQQRRRHGVDRKGPETGPLLNRERLGGDQAEDVREHRGECIRKDHSPLRSRR